MPTPPPAQGGGVPGAPPPPPPGWPGAQQNAQGAQAAQFSPAFFAAMLAQMQRSQGQNGQPPPPPPPQTSDEILVRRITVGSTCSMICRFIARIRTRFGRGTRPTREMRLDDPPPQNPRGASPSAGGPCLYWPLTGRQRGEVL
ncbi:predicted protein [Verticillium alfalfae VaMs.102]|uniref:Predicted protein n=1 Tax=Verticillium alfalfae (strain VaMs.102 / ATCC MYA-4576 / FGSC 10136) TaxID=526221 RepID=C9S6G5_VERA1|nr:predicted protein [Verticillium alfalfae VaMs.102]EEY15152.1 predicted protein [Verticillium alfalfae VaMs.102]